MMTMTSFSMWIELGLLALFVIFVLSMLGVFYMKAHGKYKEPQDKSMRSTGKPGLFQRNKRRADRMACDLPLELRDRTEYVKTGSGRVLNLSNSGACLTSRSALLLGERIQGRLTSLNNEIVKVYGHVVWIRPGRSGNYYGIQF